MPLRFPHRSYLGTYVLIHQFADFHPYTGELAMGVCVCFCGYKSLIFFLGKGQRQVGLLFSYCFVGGQLGTYDLNTPNGYQIRYFSFAVEVEQITLY